MSITAQKFVTYSFTDCEGSGNPLMTFQMTFQLLMGGRPRLPGKAIESAAAATLATKSGLWTLGFKTVRDVVY